jgi:hypothetical protein
MAWACGEQGTAAGAMMLSVLVRTTGQRWERGRDTVADRSAIEWTTATWNPTTGCDRISPGCDNCYALALAGRLKAMGQLGA